MKLKKNVAKPLIAVLLATLMLTCANVLAVPTIPHQFYGYVQVSGPIGTIPAPDGTTVEAKIGEVTYASTTTKDGRYGYDPLFMVPGDDPETTEKEGGEDGDTIDFLVAEICATSYTFEHGESTQLNLAVTDNISPSTPTNLRKLTPDSDTTPTFAWNPATDNLGVESYQTRIDDGSWISTTATSWTSPIPIAYGSHTFYVRAVDFVHNIGDTASLSFTLAPPPPPPPGKATLTVDTTPIKANVYVDNILWGIAPQTKLLDAGTYTISFGDALGYLTPAAESVTLAADETRTVTGIYTEIPPENIEKQSPPYEIPSITPAENATVEVENTVITELTISVKNTVENVLITVQQLTERPLGIEIAAPGISYKHLNVVAQNITDADIESVTITFKVEKSWITEHEIDETTITLNRYAAGEWTSIPTEKVDEDATYVYFSAVSPGLSVFAVSGTALAPDFSISVDPTSGSIVQGESTTATVSVSPVAGFTETVSLSASGLPSGTTANFSPSSGTPSFNSTLTISTSSTTPTGTYSITITGTGGEKTHSCTYTLTVTEYALPAEFELSNLSVTPAEVGPGETVTITAMVTNVGDLEGSYTATLTVNGAVESTETVTLTGGESTTVTFTVTKTEPGTYTVKVDDLEATFTVVAPLAPAIPIGYVAGAIIAIIAAASAAAVLIRRSRKRS